MKTNLFTFKRIIILFLPMAFLLMVQTSCKKCHVCTVLDEDDNAIFEYPEVCGLKSDLKSYKDRCDAEYGSFDEIRCVCGERD